MEVCCLEQYRQERGRLKQSMKGMKVGNIYKLRLFEKGMSMYCQSRRPSVWECALYLCINDFPS